MPTSWPVISTTCRHNSSPAAAANIWQHQLDELSVSSRSWRPAASWHSGWWVRRISARNDLIIPLTDCHVRGGSRMVTNTSVFSARCVRSLLTYIVPEMMWCISESANCDLEGEQHWWQRKCSAGTARKLNRD